MFKWHLLVAAALMVAATSVSAEVMKAGSKTTGRDVSPPASFYSSADDSTLVKVTDAVGLPTSEVTTFRTGATPIINSTIAVAGADSSAVINVKAYRWVGLAIACEKSILGSARYAVQVRYHVGGGTDSTTTFPLSSSMYACSDSVGATTNPVIVANPAAVATATALGGTEFLASFSAQTLMAGGRKFYFLFSNSEFRFDYISVKVRLLGGPGSCPTKVYLVGGSR